MRKIVIFAGLLNILASAVCAEPLNCENLAKEGRQLAQKVSYVMEITREAENKGKPDYSNIFGFSNLKYDRLLLESNISLQRDYRCPIEAIVVSGMNNLTSFMAERGQPLR
jgi:hypothetical protein